MVCRVDREREREVIYTITMLQDGVLKAAPTVILISADTLLQ